MAKVIEAIPELRGKAASWFEDLLRRGDKDREAKAEQARRDREIADRIRERSTRADR